jgi:phospholipase/carboxylesterase
MNLERLPLTAVYHPVSIKSSDDDGFLMVVLHGRGDSPEGFAWLPAELGISNLGYLMVQAPDDYFGGYSWYDLPPNRLPGILRSRAVLNQLFDELAHQGYRFEQIVLLGFSQGCLMTLEFGARYAHRLAGYIGISGFCNDAHLLASEADATAKTGNWLITHGTDDEVISFEETRDQIATLQQSGFDIEFRAYEKTHTIDSVLELPYLRQWILNRLETKAKT